MRLLFPDNTGVCLPITVGSGSSEDGARLGGTPPKDVVPTKRPKAARYFATLPLTADTETEISLFLLFDFDEMAEASRRILGPGDNLVEVVIHEKRSRDMSTSEFISELSAHPLLIHGETPDWFVTGGEKVVESGHKIGGRPYLDQPRTQMLDELQAVTSTGFRQFVQLGFPSGAHDSPVAGDWPFADGVFHLLVKANVQEHVEWRWFWEF
jgi:hypothetical protein